jgi:hypothetical protein
MQSRNVPSRFHARLGAVLAGIPFVIVIGAAVLGLFGLPAVGAVAGPGTSIALLAIDGDPTGNSPRSVGSIEQCVSASVGRPTQIDIVVPGPGVPVDRGIGAYQFSLLYDPGSIWISDDDSNMLLAQAARSNVIPIADPRPDRNGVYESWGVDFGPSGIEPAGTSETGPGVIARITLLPQSEGGSTLTLSHVLVIDDASNRISLESVQSAIINVGRPCSSESVTPLTPTLSFGADTTVPPRSTPSAGPLPRTGGGPVPNGSHSPLTAAAFICAFVGLSLIASAARMA